jgi:hypothetical protein
VWIGIYPKPFLDRLEMPIRNVIARVAPQHLDSLASKDADCNKNVALSKFTLPPCGDAAAPIPATPARTPAAGTPPPKATPPQAPAGTMTVPQVTAPAGGRK